MGKHSEVEAGSGRLHGRLLKVLGAMSAVVALVALWQLGVFGDEPERDSVGVVEGMETPTIEDDGGGAGAAGETSSPSPTVETPSESTAAPTSAAPTSATPSPTTAAATTKAEESGRPATAACTATLTVDEQWGGSVDVTVEVVNTGGVELASWEIDLGLDGLDVYHHWNMRELGGDRYRSEDWNGRLDPDENAIAGFQAETEDRFELPGSVSCTARA